MVKIKEKERAIIEFTCIPEVSIEKAKKLYNVGFKHLKELLDFTLDDEAKSKGLVDILNYKILSHFLDLKDEDIPIKKFKCPFCKGTVFADEDECSDCGALMLEEILGVEMEDVHKGLQEMIDTIIANPEPAKKYLDGLSEGEEETSVEEMEIVTSEIGEQTTTERGFVATFIVPKKEKGNNVIVVSPLGEHEEEKKKAFEDFKEIGAEDAESYSIEGGNIINKQEEAIKSFVSKFFKEKDIMSQGTVDFFILNFKIARFLESKATIIVEDNRNFLSSIEGIEPDEPRIEDITNMLYNAELIKKIKKIGEKFILDAVSFNNDPISFFLAKECIPILKENDDFTIHILDVVVNSTYINHGNHNELVRLLLEWK